nr:hypothetical protein HK105_000007 [Polyrhizophydium stewartii]
MHMADGNQSVRAGFGTGNSSRPHMLSALSGLVRGQPTSRDSGAERDKMLPSAVQPPAAYAIPLHAATHQPRTHAPDVVEALVYTPTFASDESPAEAGSAGRTALGLSWQARGLVTGLAGLLAGGAMPTGWWPSPWALSVRLAAGWFIVVAAASVAATLPLAAAGLPIVVILGLSALGAAAAAVLAARLAARALRRLLGLPRMLLSLASDSVAALIGLARHRLLPGQQERQHQQPPRDEIHRHDHEQQHVKVLLHHAPPAYDQHLAPPPPQQHLMREHTRLGHTISFTPYGASAKR